jgi:hypothetical protein
MSKLLDKLETISEGRAQPIGFGAAASREKRAPMLVVAAVPSGNARLNTAAEDGGADAVLVIADRKAEQASRKVAAPKTGVPWGASLNPATAQAVRELVEAKCDFVVLSPEGTQAAVLREEGIGKILQVDPSLDDNLVRAINRLDVDAVLLAPLKGEAFPLTVQQVMAFERLAAAAGKHILAAVPAEMPVEDVEILWALGAGALVVDLAVDNPEARLAEVKQAIEKLPANRKRPKSRMSASLPLSREWSGQGAPDEEEEEEDD